MWETHPTQRVSILRVAGTPLNRGTLRGKCLSLQAYALSYDRLVGRAWSSNTEIPLLILLDVVGYAQRDAFIVSPRHSRLIVLFLPRFESVII